MSQKNFEEAYKVAYLTKDIFASDETINSAQTAANTFAAESRNYNAFSDNIRKKNLNKLFAEDLKRFDMFQFSGGSSRDVLRWAYDAEKGDVSDVKRVGDKFVVAAVTKVKPKGLPAVADIRSRIETVVKNELKAKDIIKKIGSNNSLESIASATGQTISRADSVNFSTAIAPNIGNEPKVIGAAFNKSNEGKTSSPIIGNSGVFVIKTNNIYATSGNIQTPETMQKQMAQQQKQNQYAVFEAMKKAADISDNRAKFNY